MDIRSAHNVVVSRPYGCDHVAAVHALPPVLQYASHFYLSNASSSHRYNRVYPEIGGMFTDHMDILTLTRWRATCRTNYQQAVKSLHRSVMKQLNPFIPSPSAITDIVTTHGALFGGEFALCFLLRDPAYRPETLEIFVSSHQYTELVTAVFDDPRIQPYITGHAYSIYPMALALKRMILQTLQICLASGRSVYIHCSLSSTAAAGIVRSPTTAVTNYVSSCGFACGYPRLTLDRKGLLSDFTLEDQTELDKKTMNNMLAHGFSFSVSPAAWMESQEPANADDTLSPGRCWRSRFLCPAQGRYFGDAGTFLDYFDPLAGHDGYCADTGQPPYGPMIVWRLMSTFLCDDDCDAYSDILEEGTSALPVLFVKDPYGHAHDLLSHRDSHARCYQRAPRIRSQSI